MEFIYFIQGGRAGRSTWPRTLQDRLGNASVRETHRGPGGGGGVYVATSTATLAAIADPADPWVWVADPEADNVRIGYDPHNPPTPADLARDEQINGYMVALNDGAEWAVPMVRVHPTGSCVPSLIEYTAEGPREVPNPRYRQLCDDAETIWSAIMAAEQGNTAALSIADQSRFALAALATNYRLGPGECNALQLLTSEQAYLVCSAMVDLPGYIRDANPALLDAASKKNLPTDPPETDETQPSGDEG